MFSRGVETPVRCLSTDWLHTLAPAGSPVIIGTTADQCSSVIPNIGDLTPGGLSALFMCIARRVVNHWERGLGVEFGLWTFVPILIRYAVWFRGSELVANIGLILLLSSQEHARQVAHRQDPEESNPVQGLYYVSTRTLS